MCPDRILATCHDLVGATAIEVVVKRGGSRKCRTYHYPNYKILFGSKVNSIRLSAIPGEGVLFVNSLNCFTKRFLRYHVDMLYGSQVPSSAAVWGMRRIPGASVHSSYQSEELFRNALHYFMQIDALESIGRHLNVHIGNDLSDTEIAMYKRHLIRNVFPPSDQSKVTELVGDGHVKVRVRGRCLDSKKKTKANKGRQNRSKAMKSKGKKGVSNGWFMLVDPASKKIVNVMEMKDRENNAVVLNSLREVLPMYTNCNAFIMDRCCQFYKMAMKENVCDQIKFYMIDKFHASLHVKTCKCSPLYVKTLKKRMKGVNGSICEITFSWFRRYAKILNPMAANRHRFVVLYLAHMHNQCVEADDMSHMKENFPARRRQRSVKPYGCR